MKIYQFQAKKTSSSPQIMNFLYSQAIFSFSLQYYTRKIILMALKRAYMPKLWVSLDFGQNH